MLNELVSAQPTTILEKSHTSWQVLPATLCSDVSGIRDPTLSEPLAVKSRAEGYQQPGMNTSGYHNTSYVDGRWA